MCKDCFKGLDLSKVDLAALAPYAGKFLSEDWLRKHVVYDSNTGDVYVKPDADLVTYSSQRKPNE
jgi:hypothetical protein